MELKTSDIWNAQMNKMLDNAIARGSNDTFIKHFEDNPEILAQVLYECDTDVPWPEFCYLAKHYTHARGLMDGFMAQSKAITNKLRAIL